MKVVIVNCFDTYEDRVDLLHDFFVNKGFDVTIIQSNFRHFKKVYRMEDKKNFIFVESKPYYKNMSVARLTSHYSYAKSSFKIVEKIKPDLLYVLIPPNSLAKFAAKYKKKYSNVKLILDLIDLWPESLPVGKIKDLPPFIVWRLMRDNSLQQADFVITECNLYKSILENVLKGIKTETIYLAKKEFKIDSYPKINRDNIHLCYLGSINNIIDIPKIKAIIKTIHEIKPVTLHIIGDGENKQIFIDEINKTGASIEYHGKIFDTKKKQDIFDKCHFGLNIMKDYVCVGLTMKSIDYFQAGLPVLNNIKADTYYLVEEYRAGLNIANDNIFKVARKVTEMDLIELLAMRNNSKKLYKNMFSYEAFKSKMEEVFFVNIR